VRSVRDEKKQSAAAASRRLTTYNDLCPNYRLMINISDNDADDDDNKNDLITTTSSTNLTLGIVNYVVMFKIYIYPYFSVKLF